MLKCKDCRLFTFASYCCVDGETHKDCSSRGDETKCELYPERRKNAQERLEAELSRRVAAKWFDFEKQKPVHGDCVLGIDTEGQFDVYQYSEEWSGCLMKYDGIVKVFNITHWMPLPELPKEDKNEML